MHVKRIELLPREQQSAKDDGAVLNRKKPICNDTTLMTKHHVAWVIDESLSEDFMSMVHDVRLSLPLDAKRPTVKRRFFSAAKERPAIIEGLQRAVQTAIQYDEPTLTEQLNQGENPQMDDQATTTTGITKERVKVHVLSYMRYLEYDKIGGRLDPHTDGNKVCEETGHRSTHTLLLYLRDCHRGGETVLLESSKKKGEASPVVVEAIQPRLGRILLFPHAIWHEGAPTEDVPKICLRAEVCLYRKDNDKLNN